MGGGGRRVGDRPIDPWPTDPTFLADCFSLIPLSLSFSSADTVLHTDQLLLLPVTLSDGLRSANSSPYSAPPPPNPLWRWGGMGGVLTITQVHVFLRLATPPKRSLDDIWCLAACIMQTCPPPNPPHPPGANAGWVMALWIAAISPPSPPSKQRAASAATLCPTERHTVPIHRYMHC